MHPPPRDEELIAGICRGEEKDLVELMKRHKEAVFRFAFRYLDNEADSAEVAEETFFKVYQNADRFRPRATAKTWIFSIARNLAIDRLRKKKTRGTPLSLQSPISSQDSASLSLADRTSTDAPSPSQKLQSGDDLSTIHRAISRLPEKLRYPFVFCVLEEHSYDECADILKTNRKTIEMRIYRARQALKGDLANFLQTF
ncbi:MAG: RNA polymerase sigma factor [Puniceicoccales bacterium]